MTSRRHVKSFIIAASNVSAVFAKTIRATWNFKMLVQAGWNLRGRPLTDTTGRLLGTRREYQNKENNVLPPFVLTNLKYSANLVRSNLPLIFSGDRSFFDRNIFILQLVGCNINKTSVCWSMTQMGPFIIAIFCGILVLQSGYSKKDAKRKRVTSKTFLEK